MLSPVDYFPDYSVTRYHLQFTNGVHADYVMTYYNTSKSPEFTWMFEHWDNRDWRVYFNTALVN